MSKTKIVIFQLKEIIYTAIFVGLGILLILLLIFMFWQKNDNKEVTAQIPIYKAGVYTSTIVLNDTSLNVEVVVDENHIKSVKIVNIDEAITTMYPLLKSSLEDIATQLYKDVDIKDINLSDDSKYTQTLLIDSIKNALAKATP